MQFSDTTNKAGLIEDITFWTGVGTSEYTLADRTRNINEWYRKIITMILQAQDSWDFDDKNATDFPILTASMVANQQDYSLPAGTSGVIDIKRVELSYDGGSSWKRAFPLAINEMTSSTDASTIASQFGSDSPFYGVQYNSLFLYPIPGQASANGIKIWISRDIHVFVSTDDTQTPGFDQQFHRMLSIGAAFDWATAKSQANAGTLGGLLQDFEARLKAHYGAKDKDRNYQLKGDIPNYD